MIIKTGINNADSPAPAKKGAHTKGSFDLAISSSRRQSKDQHKKRDNQPKPVIGRDDDPRVDLVLSPARSHDRWGGVERSDAMKRNERQRKPEKRLDPAALHDADIKLPKFLASTIGFVKQNEQKDGEGQHKKTGELPDHEPHQMSIVQKPRGRHRAHEFFRFHC